MERNTLNVMRGFLNLSSEEQVDFLKELNVYRGYYWDSEKKSFKEKVDSRIKSLGPKNSICECCGK